MVLSQKNKRKVSGFFSAQCDNLPGWKDVLKKYAVVKANLLYAFNEKKKKKKSLSCLHGDRDLLNLRC